MCYQCLQLSIEKNLTRVAIKVSGLHHTLQLTCTVPSEHEKRMERYIRILKDQKRTIMFSCLYVLSINL